MHTCIMHACRHLLTLARCGGVGHHACIMHACAMHACKLMYLCACMHAGVAAWGTRLAKATASNLRSVSAGERNLVQVLHESAATKPAATKPAAESGSAAAAPVHVVGISGFFYAALAAGLVDANGRVLAGAVKSEGGVEGEGGVKGEGGVGGEVQSAEHGFGYMESATVVEKLRALRDAPDSSPMDVANAERILTILETIFKQVHIHTYTYTYTYTYIHIHTYTYLTILETIFKQGLPNVRFLMARDCNLDGQPFRMTWTAGWFLTELMGRWANAGASGVHRLAVPEYTHYKQLLHGQLSQPPATVESATVESATVESAAATARSGQVGSGQVKSGQVTSEQVGSGQVEPLQVETGRVEPSQVHLSSAAFAAELARHAQAFEPSPSPTASPLTLTPHPSALTLHLSLTPHPHPRAHPHT